MVTTLHLVPDASSLTRRLYIGARDTDPRWSDREVDVVFRSNGPGPRNALVQFDTGERVVVATYSGGRGATLRIPSRGD